jgi:hypothetical protein
VLTLGAGDITTLPELLQRPHGSPSDYWRTYQTVEEEFERLSRGRDTVPVTAGLAVFTY